LEAQPESAAAKTMAVSADAEFMSIFL